MNIRGGVEANAGVLVVMFKTPEIRSGIPVTLTAEESRIPSQSEPCKGFGHEDSQSDTIAGLPAPLARSLVRKSLAMASGRDRAGTHAAVVRLPRPGCLGPPLAALHRAVDDIVDAAEAVHLGQGAAFGILGHDGIGL